MDWLLINVQWNRRDLMGNVRKEKIQNKGETDAAN